MCVWFGLSLLCVSLFIPPSHPFALCGLLVSSVTSFLSFFQRGEERSEGEKEKKSFALLGWEPVSRRLVSRRVIQHVDSRTLASSGLFYLFIHWLNRLLPFSLAYHPSAWYLAFQFLISYATTIRHSKKHIVHIYSEWQLLFYSFNFVIGI